jgi:hypothetical protein
MRPVGAQSVRLAVRKPRGALKLMATPGPGRVLETAPEFRVEPLRL